MKFRILFSLKQINKMIEVDLTSKKVNKKSLEETQKILNSLLSPDKTQLIEDETIIFDAIDNLKSIITDMQSKTEIESETKLMNETEKKKVKEKRTEPCAITKLAAEIKFTDETNRSAKTKRNAESNYYPALTILALFAFEGFYVQTDHFEALKLFELANGWKVKGKKNTNAVALCYLARYHELGLADVAKNIHEAVKQYELSVKSNFAVAQTWLSSLLDEHIIGEWDEYTEVTNLLELAMDQYYPSAHVEFAQCIERGAIGINGAIPIRQLYTPESAIEYYRIAGKLGYLPGTWHLARCYQYGIGVTLNLRTAVTLYHMNVEQGCPMSQNSLGNYYMKLDKRRGGGYSTLGAQFYLNAAKQGHVQATRNLAKCFFNGIGTKKDLIQAFKAYEIAAKQGCTSSQKDLWKYYITGIWHYKEREKALVKFSRMPISDPDLRDRIEKLKNKEIIQNTILTPYFQDRDAPFNLSIIKMIADFACYPNEDELAQDPFQRDISDDEPDHSKPKKHGVVKSSTCVIQ